MAQMNSRQAQVIDPILTEQARGYKNAEFIGDELFPRIPIPNRSMKVLSFGKESFRQYLDTRRSPGSQTKQITFGYSSNPIALNQDALDAAVPIETMQDAKAIPGIDMAAHSINLVQDIIKLGQEFATAALARDPANYKTANQVELLGAQNWSDPNSNPAADVKAAANIIRRMIGRKPNKLLLSPRVFDVLTLHPRIQEQFKYTSADSITVDMLAKYFVVDKVVVGNGVALPENAADDVPADDVWGNDAILAYVPQNGNYMVPAFGYNYILEGYPIVEAADWRSDRKSWVYGVTEEWRPYMVGAEGGFLFRAPAGKVGDGGGSSDGGGQTQKFYRATAVPSEQDLQAQLGVYFARRPDLVSSEVAKLVAANERQAKEAIEKARKAEAEAKAAQAAAEAKIAEAKAAAEKAEADKAAAEKAAKAEKDKAAR